MAQWTCRAAARYRKIRSRHESIERLLLFMARMILDFFENYFCCLSVGATGTKFGNDRIKLRNHEPSGLRIIHQSQNAFYNLMRPCPMLKKFRYDLLIG